jgi:hypothetical protein
MPLGVMQVLFCDFQYLKKVGSDGVPTKRLCMITDVVPEELGLPSDTTSGDVGYSRFVRTDDLGTFLELGNVTLN